jgi:hypothetical protein
MNIENNSLIFLYENKIAIYSIFHENDVFRISLVTEIPKDDKLIYDV